MGALANLLNPRGAAFNRAIEGIGAFPSENSAQQLSAVEDLATQLTRGRADEEPMQRGLAALKLMMRPYSLADGLDLEGNPMKGHTDAFLKAYDDVKDPQVRMVMDVLQRIAFLEVNKTQLTQADIMSHHYATARALEAAKDLKAPASVSDHIRIAVFGNTLDFGAMSRRIGQILTNISRGTQDEEAVSRFLAIASRIYPGLSGAEGRSSIHQSEAQGAQVVAAEREALNSMHGFASPEVRMMANALYTAIHFALNATQLSYQDRGRAPYEVLAAFTSSNRIDPSKSRAVTR